MNTHKPYELETDKKAKRFTPNQRANILARVVKTLIGALIGTMLTSLFSVVIFAFVIKAFTTSDEMSFQLLNSAITLVGTSLGAVLGYFLGKNSNGKS